MPQNVPPPDGPRPLGRAVPRSRRPPPRAALAFLALVLAALLSACGGSGGIETKPFRTVVLEPATLQALAAYDGGDALLFEPPDRIDEFDGVITDSLPDQIDDLDVGDVLVAPPSEAAPHGLLRRVTRIVRGRTGVRVVTEQATLEDAVNGSDLDPGLYTMEVPIDLSAAEPLPRLGTLELRTGSGEAADDPFFASLPPDLYAARRDLLASDLDPAWSYPFYKKTACAKRSQRDAFPAGIEVDGGACVRAELALRIDVRIGVRWRWFVPVPTIDSFRASIRGQVDGSLALGVDTTETARVAIPYLNERILLGRLQTAPLVAWLGPIPVVTTPAIEFFLEVKGDVKISARLALDDWLDYETSMHAELGVLYRRGKGWRPIRSFDFTPDIDPDALRTPRLDASAVAEVNASMAAPNARAALYFYGLLGPAVSANATAGFTYRMEAGRPPRGSISTELGFVISVADRIPIVDLDRALRWSVRVWKKEHPL